MAYLNSKRVLIRTVILLVVLSAGAPLLHAASFECGKVAKQVEQEKAGFYPRRSYSVEGSGRLYFHTAPDARCRSKDIFVIPEDRLIVYTSYDGWLEVMYTNPKTGEDYSGWVRSERLKFNGTLGPAE